MITLPCLQAPPLPAPLESKTPGGRSEEHLALGQYQVLKPVTQAGRDQSQGQRGPKQA